MSQAGRVGFSYGVTVRRTGRAIVLPGLRHDVSASVTASDVQAAVRLPSETQRVGELDPELSLPSR